MSPELNQKIESVMRRGIGHTVVQLVLYLLLLYIGWALIRPRLPQDEGRVMTPLALILSFAVFGSLLLMQNILTALLPNRQLYSITLFVVSLLYTVSWFNQGSECLWAPLVFVLCGLLTQALKLWLDRKYLINNR